MALMWPQPHRVARPCCNCHPAAHSHTTPQACHLLACHKHPLSCPQDQLIQDSDWISFCLLCFVLLIMLLQFSIALCCTPPYTTCSSVVAATSPRRVSSMRTPGQAALPYWSCCATKPLKHAPPKKPTPCRAGSTTPRRCCFTPCHHPCKIPQPLVATVCDPSMMSFFFLSFFFFFFFSFLI